MGRCAIARNPKLLHAVGASSAWVKKAPRLGAPRRLIHDTQDEDSRVRARSILYLTGVLATAPLAAQSAARPGIAVLNLRFDGEHANVLEAGDTAVVRAATSRLLAALRASDHVRLVDSGSVAVAVAAAEADGNPCDHACARAIARQLGARWVAKGTVSKTSNLVWMLSAQHGQQPARCGADHCRIPRLEIGRAHV